MTARTTGTVTTRYVCARCATTVITLEVVAATDEPRDVVIPLAVLCRLCAGGHGPAVQAEAM